MQELERAILTVPEGGWAVGVSGGADSVALLALLRRRDDLRLHVAHLDHETRAGESGDDARFVEELARKWVLPATVARRGEIEATMRSLPRNRSARYRALRLELFRRVVSAAKLSGVILAHHADDQAETVLQRLLRGAGVGGLAGMRADANISRLRILRPLLEIRREKLRAFLARENLEWREDSSNTLLNQQRNRVRALLASQEGLTEKLLKMASACQAYADWLRRCAPVLEESFPARALADLPRPLACQAAGRWLSERAKFLGEISPAAINRLIEMSVDAATSPRQSFPGGILVRRRGGRISAD